MYRTFCFIPLIVHKSVIGIKPWKDRNVVHVILDFTDYQETMKSFLFLSLSLSRFSFPVEVGANFKYLNFEARSIFFHFELLRHLLINLNTKQYGYTECKLYEDKIIAVKMAQMPIFQKQDYFNVQDFKELVFLLLYFKILGCIILFCFFC